MPLASNEARLAARLPPRGPGRGRARLRPPRRRAPARLGAPDRRPARCNGDRRAQALPAHGVQVLARRPSRCARPRTVVCDPQAVRGSRPSSGGLDRGSRPGRALSRRRQRGLASAGRECRRAGPISRPPPAAPAHGAARRPQERLPGEPGPPRRVGRCRPLDLTRFRGHLTRWTPRPRREPSATFTTDSPPRISLPCETHSLSEPSNKGATDRRGCLIKGSSRAIFSFPVPPYGEGRGICN